MRKETSTLIACFVLCTVALAVSGVETFTDKKHGFEISLPERWSSDGQYLNWMSARSTDKNAWFQLNIDPVRNGDGLRSCFENESNKSSMRSSALTDIRLYKVAGRVALKMELDDKTDPFYHSALYYVVSGTHGYAIWFWAAKNDFDKHVKDFDAIVASFKMIEAK